MVTLGSLFDGIGGFMLGAARHGIKPIWSSEIDPACETITKYWFPDTLQLGDIRYIDGANIPPVDIISGGTPCQDLSIAGKQAGIQHSDLGHKGETRSGLFMDMIRIIREMRGATSGQHPKYVVWENVLGSLSSNKGEDFKVVIEEFCQCANPSAVIPRPKKWLRAGTVMGDGFSFAWRTLDAQYWGVPQRRRRVYAVLSFGEAPASKILFKQAGSRGYFAESKGEGESVASDVTRSVNRSNRDRKYGAGPLTESQVTTYPIDNRSSRFNLDKGQVAGTLTSRMGTGGNNGPMVMESRRRSTLCMASPMANAEIGVNKAPTLLASHEKPVLAHYHPTRRRYMVRRLTPLECERLQGFPDGWTDVYHNKKRVPDTTKYRVIGNSVAIPCVEFVFGQIADYNEGRW